MACSYVKSALLILSKAEVVKQALHKAREGVANCIAAPFNIGAGVATAPGNSRLISCGLIEVPVAELSTPRETAVVALILRG
jgi:hypothetical protein